MAGKRVLKKRFFRPPLPVLFWIIGTKVANIERSTSVSRSFVSINNWQYQEGSAPNASVLLMDLSITTLSVEQLVALCDCEQFNWEFVKKKKKNTGGNLAHWMHQKKIGDTTYVFIYYFHNYLENSPFCLPTYATGPISLIPWILPIPPLSQTGW
jgi:hypothetical protein